MRVDQTGDTISILSPVRLDLQSNTCSGAIYDERRVLTAASCTDGIEAEDITVWLGDGESGHAVCGFNYQLQDLKGYFKDEDIIMLDLCEPLTLTEGKFYIFWKI